MAPKYKLTYFSLTGRGEPIRFLLSYGNLEFEDVRIRLPDWMKHKAKFPLGQVPILEIDGKVIHQTVAICRLLAKQLNLVGKNDWDSLQADIVVDTVNDLVTPIVGYFYDPNPETRAPKLKPLQEETIPFYLSRLDKQVAENGGYFVGGQLTWADLYFISFAEYFGKLAEFDFFKDYPNLRSLNEKVVNIPQIKKWIATRPPDRRD